MVETAIYSKNKIQLADYDYQKDLRNRELMAQFSEKDVALIDEMICSPARVSLINLSRQANQSVEETLSTLDKLAPTGLFTCDGEYVTTDKETRKYFEVELLKFEESFAPTLDFLRLQLKKVPLDALMSWYPIPRTSNNIFESLIEKYFKKPLVFQRYLKDLDLEDATFNAVKEDLLHSCEKKLYADEIKKKYGLTAAEFQKMALLFEFNFVSFLCYEKKDEQWTEVLTLFQEWKDYLAFMHNSSTKKVLAPHTVVSTRPEEFSFVEDISTLLHLARNIDVYVEIDAKERWIFERQTLAACSSHFKGFDLESKEGQEIFFDYLCRLIKKLLLIKLATIDERKLTPASHTPEWLDLAIDQRALHLYKLTTTHYSFSEFPSEICNDRTLREVEKSVRRIKTSGWVFFEDFMAGVIVPIGKDNAMELKQVGRSWKYKRPIYSEEERALIKKVIYDWLFEAGVIQTGTLEGKECLRMTSFGQAAFG